MLVTLFGKYWLGLCVLLVSDFSFFSFSVVPLLLSFPLWLLSSLFSRACRTDDILVQAILRKPRKHVSDILRKAHQQSIDSKGQHSVAYYFEQELMEAFQETLPGNKQGTSPGSLNQSRIGSGKLAQTVGAVGKLDYISVLSSSYSLLWSMLGKATVSAAFDFASKAMSWMGSSSNNSTKLDEEGNEETD
jgi:hypothetical protein